MANRDLASAKTFRFKENSTYLGNISIVRRLWNVGPREFASLVDEDCEGDPPNLVYMLFVPVEHPTISKLRCWIESQGITVRGGDPVATLTEVKALLGNFNALYGATIKVYEPCTAKGHVSNGQGGCVPGSGYMFVLQSGPDPSTRLFQTLTTYGHMQAGDGYILSVALAELA